MPKQNADVAGAGFTLCDSVCHSADPSPVLKSLPKENQVIWLGWMLRKALYLIPNQIFYFVEGESTKGGKGDV